MQTSYDLTQEVGVAGQKADAGFDRVESFAAEGAVPFGRAVIRGTADNQAEVADSAEGEFLGVAIRTHTQEQDFPEGGAEYRDEDTVSVLTDGVIFVETLDDNTDAGDLAYVDVTAGDDQGKFTTSDDGTLGPVGKFLTSGDENEIVQVRVDQLYAGLAAYLLGVIDALD